MERLFVNIGRGNKRDPPPSASSLRTKPEPYARSHR